MKNSILRSLGLKKRSQMFLKFPNIRKVHDQLQNEAIDIDFQKFLVELFLCSILYVFTEAMQNILWRFIPNIELKRKHEIVHLYWCVIRLSLRHTRELFHKFLKIYNEMLFVRNLDFLSSQSKIHPPVQEILRPCAKKKTRINSNIIF